MIPLLAVVISAATTLWSATVPFTPGRSVALDAHAGPLLLSTLEMTDRSDLKRIAAAFTLTAANVGNKDAEVVFTATLLDAQGLTLAVEEESAELEEGDVKKIRFRITLPAGKTAPVASVKLEVTND